MKVLNDELGQFYGTEQYYNHPLFKQVVYTDGVRYLRTLGLNWFVDKVMAELPHVPLDEVRSIELIKIDEEDNFVVRYKDEDKVHETEPFWSDFDYDKLLLFVGESPFASSKYVVLLPSEY